MLSKHLFHASTVRLCLLVAMLCGVLFSSVQSSSNVQAASSQPIMQKQDAFQTGITSITSNPSSFINCNPINGIVVFVNRIHVQCQDSGNGIIFFAVSTADNQFANRVLSVLLTAHATGKPLSIEYDLNNESGPSFGCALNDCRPIIFAQITN